MSSMTGSRKLQRGAAALEFAIVLPVLMLLLVGMVDFGVVLSAQTTVAIAAREGARTAALGQNEGAAENAARQAISSLPGASNVGTTTDAVCTKPDGSSCSLSDSDPDTGSTVTVTVAYVHTWLSPVFLGLSPTVTLQGKSMMRIE